MKKITFISKILFLSLVFSLSNCHESTAQQADQATTVLAPDDFEAKALKADVQLIDVRTPDEYKAGHITNAKNINFYAADFKNQMEKLDKSKAIAVYCGVGGRSGKASTILTQLGFKMIYDLQGGMSAWKAKGKKVSTE